MATTLSHTKRPKTATQRRVMYTNGEMSIVGYNVNYQTTYTFVQSSNCLLFYVDGSQLAAAYRDCAIISLQHSHTKIMFDKDLFRICGYKAAATLPPSTGVAEPNVVRKFLIYSKPKNYGYYADQFDVTRGLQDDLFFRYRNRILRIQDDLVRRSPEPQQMKDMYFALPNYTRSTSHSAKVYGQRAVQVLHYHAHTIQLFFRRIAERRRLGLLHFLMEQQTGISYLHCEYVLRDIVAFGI